MRKKSCEFPPLGSPVRAFRRLKQERDFEGNIRAVDGPESSAPVGILSREPKKIFAELKRRNVYKVAIAYAVTAWVLNHARHLTTL